MPCGFDARAALLEPLDEERRVTVAETLRLGHAVDVLHPPVDFLRKGGLVLVRQISRPKRGRLGPHTELRPEPGKVDTLPGRSNLDPKNRLTAKAPPGAAKAARGCLQERRLQRT